MNSLRSDSIDFDVILLVLRLTTRGQSNMFYGQAYYYIKQTVADTLSPTSTGEPSRVESGELKMEKIFNVSSI